PAEEQVRGARHGRGRARDGRTPGVAILRGGGTGQAQPVHAGVDVPGYARGDDRGAGHLQGGRQLHGVGRGGEAEREYDAAEVSIGRRGANAPTLGTPWGRSF